MAKDDKSKTKGGSKAPGKSAKPAAKPAPKPAAPAASGGKKVAVVKVPVLQLHQLVAVTSR